ncbi:Aste57867_219 [Aphanomyces stellatus]|uniref:Aste57867_219 protein n=1 Tax=Aphanomyces stellatus TaxID=120398 RepID=A0A485K296_9STRA|nr:hypothetical protein As57867_000219 [Aphanomyces stellatus]VFT77445.1 Aste57867_219 [Aphanomyces stellatus]
MLVLFESLDISEHKFSATHGISRSTWYGWMQTSDKIKASKRNKKRPTLGGQGKKPIIPFTNELVSFMKGVRREEHILTSMHMVTFMKTYHREWLENYTADKGDPYKRLLELCQAFAHRHRFAHRVPCHSKMVQAELDGIRDDFAAKFWGKYGTYKLRHHQCR